VECTRSREAAHRSELAGWAKYGYCASHSRYFWGQQLHLLCTLHGLPVGFAVSGAKADEREVLLGILDADPALTAGRAGQTVIAYRHYYGRQFETTLNDHGVIRGNTTQAVPHSKETVNQRATSFDHIARAPPFLASARCYRAGISPWSPCFRRR
jgi:hypothetical protein